MLKAPLNNAPKLLLLLTFLTVGALPAFSQTKLSPTRIAIKEELKKIELPALCEQKTTEHLRCEGHFVANDGTPHPLYIIHSSATQTAYAYIRLGHLPVGAKNNPALLSQMMSLNWHLLASKFEWNQDTGEVRLSSLLHTDSNFDRKAFRSVVRNLMRNYERYHASIIQKIQASDD